MERDITEKGPLEEREKKYAVSDDANGTSTQKKWFGNNKRIETD